MLNLSDLATVPPPAARAAATGAADIIIVSGGNTLHAVNRWRRLGVDTLLKEAMERGAVLAGGSVRNRLVEYSIHIRMDTAINR